MDFTCSSEDGVTPSAFPQQLRFREQRLRGHIASFIMFHPGSNYTLVSELQLFSWEVLADFYAQSSVQGSGFRVGGHGQELLD